MAKRKRHNKKAHLQGVKISFVRKRGKLVATPEAELQRTTEELRAELNKYKELKSALRQAKERKRRQPRPVGQRQALDHLPVDAGHRKDMESRARTRDAAKAERQALR